MIMKYFPGGSRSLSHAFWLALLLLALPALSVRADSDLDAANRAYTYGSYDEAAGLFQKIVDQRGYSAPLCFDLANAEARAGHPGAAMLNYERARYLAPGDKEIDHNLQIARKQAGLEPNTYRWWQVALRSIDWTVWMAAIAVGLVLIFLAIVGLSYLPPLASGLNLPVPLLRNIFRGILFGGIPLCLLLGYIELMTIGFNQRIDGVIVAPKAATLWLSPFASSDTLGVIPEGELVTVEKREKDYLWIEARDHHFGWVLRKDIEPVIAGSFDAN
jgi:tetratricopeptide (TPR) repeat protein